MSQPAHWIVRMHCKCSKFCVLFRKWAEKEGLPICWIPGAGHNSNTDRPEEINGLIRKFAEGLEEGER